MSLPELDPRKVPPEVIHVLRTLQRDHEAWVVGGAVRDLLRGRVRGAEDWDVATSADPEAVLRTFPRVVPTGIRHGTVTVLEGPHAVEVTTFRGEAGYTDARRPDAVSFFGPGGLERDLARRDFTANAIAWDPLSGAVVDPYGGRADLAAGILRAVGDARERFTEDGLRPMRAVRFAATLGMRLHPDTRAALRPALPSFRKVAAERVAQELLRLLAAPRPAAGLELMGEGGLWDEVLPGVPADPARIRSLDLPEHAEAVEREPAVRLAVLLRPAGPDTARRLLARLKLPRAMQERVGRLVDPRLETPPDPPSEVEARRVLARVGREEAPRLVAVWRAEGRARGEPPGRTEARVAPLRAQAGSGAPLSVGELALDGRALVARTGRPPGPWVGVTLRRLLDRVLEDPSRNTPEGLGALLDEAVPDP